MRLVQKLNRSSSHIAPMLALTGLLSLPMGVGLAASAIALPLPPNQTPYAISATPSQATQPPQAMVNALRQSLSKQTGIPAKKLRVVESTQKTWPNGCLGLAKADEMCTQAMVSGWRIVFSNGTQRWAYRTDATGKTYRLETPTQRSLLPLPSPPKPVSSIQPGQLSDTDLPSQLKADEVFRVIATGGFAGQRHQTTLLKDGHLLQVRLNSDGSTTRIGMHRVSSTQMARFQQRLQNYLPKFDRCDFPATSGSADFITMTLSSSAGTIRYADSVQNQLPQELQTLVQTWNQIEQ